MLCMLNHNNVYVYVLYNMYVGSCSSKKLIDWTQGCKDVVSAYNSGNF